MSASELKIQNEFSLDFFQKFSLFLILFQLFAVGVLSEVQVICDFDDPGSKCHNACTGGEGTVCRYNWLLRPRHTMTWRTLNHNAFARPNPTWQGLVPILSSHEKF